MEKEKMMPEHKMSFGKQFNLKDFLKVFGWLIGFVLVYSVTSYTIPNLEKSAKVLLSICKNELNIQTFLEVYLLSLFDFIMHITFLLLFGSVFSWLMNILLISEGSGFSKMEEVIGGKLRTLKVKDVSPLVAIIMLYLMLQILIQDSNFIRLQLYVPISVYLSITICRIIEKLKKSTSNGRFLNFIWSIKEILLALFIVSLYYIFGNLNSSDIFRVFIVTLIFSGLLKLYSGWLFKIVKFDLNYAIGGKDAIKKDYQEDLEQLPGALGEYVQMRNRRNLAVTIYISILLCLYIILFSVLSIINTEGEIEATFILINGLKVIIFILIVRLLSRSFEIVYAFIKDVTSRGSKSSNLDGKDRMKLAINSLIEITLLSAALRISYNLYRDIMTSTSWESILNPVRLIRFLIEEVFISIATMGFNVSYDGCSLNYVEQIVHLIQILVGIVLITLSIATYISMKDRKEE